MAKRRFETLRPQLLCFRFTSEDGSEWFHKVEKIWQGNTKQWTDLKWLRGGDTGIKGSTEGSCTSIKSRALNHCLLHSPIIFGVLYISYAAEEELCYSRQQKTLTFAFERNNTLSVSTSDSNNPHWQWVIVFLESFSMFGELLCNYLHTSHKWDMKKTECALYSSKLNDIISGEIKYTKNTISKLYLFPFLPQPRILLLHEGLQTKQIKWNVSEA